ncbi:17765_t:CDS:2 [Entrophospora sp. SA101]|nr:23897_t:CDS:2 [Entrophospora sp. SA101]CAJ0750891.1 9616_t:CDS:2 [Entrophospora sp. SA101]CAJ0753613.1 13682_t:CDS:2 [Entrophospora sp. SA101]CAJ0757697.1 17765_t:CDS:2 [Entrophospora sp. SA101]CAJ0908656.1 8936_t:CDS:2 [Entrophospora sp. SA101]
MILKVTECAATDGVLPHYIKDEILSESFKKFWVHRMANIITINKITLYNNNGIPRCHIIQMDIPTKTKLKEAIRIKEISTREPSVTRVTTQSSSSPPPLSIGLDYMVSSLPISTLSSSSTSPSG